MLVLVQIIGAPTACKEGVKDTWRDVAMWASGQLHQRFGESVDVQYFDLFDPTCPPMPSGCSYHSCWSTVKSWAVAGRFPYLQFVSGSPAPGVHRIVGQQGCAR